MNYCNVFISCLNSHSDGTHSLQRIRDVQQNFSKSLHIKKTLIYILDGLRVSTFSAKVHLCMKYSFNHKWAYAVSVPSLWEVYSALGVEWGRCGKCNRAGVQKYIYCVVYSGLRSHLDPLTAVSKTKYIQTHTHTHIITTPDYLEVLNWDPL